MEIKRTIKKEWEVGFQCDVCKKKFRTGWNQKHLPEDDPLNKCPFSEKGRFNLDDEDAEDGWINYDLCRGCFDIMVEHLESIRRTDDGID